MHLDPGHRTHGQALPPHHIPAPACVPTPHLWVLRTPIGTILHMLTWANASHRLPLTTCPYLFPIIFLSPPPLSFTDSSGYSPLTRQQRSGSSSAG